ncbi:MAG: kinase [Deltaproteobacteria bacterium]|nr:kinase [Deltaproteobacteria bacterium]
MIISRTPFRISFFGGGTDYPVWFRENGGAVLATTIDKYCYITCRYLPPFFDHRSRIVWSKIELVKEAEEIQHPAVREALRLLGITEGVEVHHDGDLPARAGLGSSSAFTVGLLHALYGLKRVMPTKSQLAQDAIRIEQERLKENVGSQDQVLAAFGGFNRVEFSASASSGQAGKNDFRVIPIILKPERLRLLHDHLLLFFTGLSRDASEIAGEQIRVTRRKREELKAMRQMVEEAIGILSGDGDIAAFGRLLHEGWLLKRSLTEKISNPVVDEIYETARKEGGIGGKLLGAGGGGFLLVFAPPEVHPGLKGALGRLLHVPFKFESHGSQIIFNEPGAAG